MIIQQMQYILKVIQIPLEISCFVKDMAGILIEFSPDNLCRKTSISALAGMFSRMYC
jgi:hypothetical protein